MPNNRIEELENEVASLRKDIEKLYPVTQHKLVSDTTVKEQLKNSDFGLFPLSKLVSYFLSDVYDNVRVEPASGRTRTKVGDAINKCFGGLCMGAFGLTLYPAAVIIDAPYSALKLSFSAAEAQANKNHNKRVLKAREKISDLRKELSDKLKELNTLKQTNELAQ